MSDGLSNILQIFLRKFSWEMLQILANFCIFAGERGKGSKVQEFKSLRIKENEGDYDD
jgi:hypothetical protein